MRGLRMATEGGMTEIAGYQARPSAALPAVQAWVEAMLNPRTPRRVLVARGNALAAALAEADEALRGVLPMLPSRGAKIARDALRRS